MTGWGNIANDDGTDAAAAQPPTQQPAPQPTPAAQSPAQQTLAAAQNPDRTGPQAPQTTSAPSPQVSGIAPVVLRPAKTGLAGIVQKVADVLAGTTKQDVYQDDSGNKYTYTRDQTGAEQWHKIIGEGIVGAASGFAAGKGAGNQAKAPLAGVQAGMQMQDKSDERDKEQTAQIQQEKLDQGNALMLRMNLAEHAWNLQRSQQKAGEEDRDFYQQQIDRLTGNGPNGGGTLIAHAAHEWDIGRALKVNPDLMKDMIQNHAIELVPHINQDGVHEGVDIVKMPDGWRKNMLPAGATFHTFDKLTGKMVEHNASDPITAGEQADYDTAAYNDQLAFMRDKQKTQADSEESGLKKQQTATGKSEEVKNYAEGREADARAQSLKSGALNPDGSPNPQFEMLAQALHDGDIMSDDLKREAKGAGLDPNAITARAVEIGKQTGVPYSESIIKQEQSFAKNEKTQAAVDGIDRIVDPKTGYMQQMLDLAQKAHLGTNGAFNSIQLAARRGLGDADARAFNTSVTELRRSIAGLIGNPLLGGSETDKKLEQADDLIGGRPTLANLQKASEVLDNALKAQRQSIVGNNRFLIKRYGTGAGQPAQQPGAVQLPPAAQSQLKEGINTTFGNGQTWTLKNGQPMQVGGNK